MSTIGAALAYATLCAPVVFVILRIASAKKPPQRPQAPVRHPR